MRSAQPNVDALPNEVNLIIFSFLPNDDLNTLMFVCKNFQHLSNKIWERKVKEDFNCSTILPNQGLFYRQLSAELAKERKLFAAYQKALFLQQFINEHFDHYDQYYLFAIIELNRCCVLETSMTAFFQGLEKHIALVAAKTQEDDQQTLQNGLVEAEKEGGKLFDKLISNPVSLGMRLLEMYLHDLCALDAHCALGIIFKKYPEMDLGAMFVVAISSFHFETVKKITELGLDVRQPIDFAKHCNYFGDFNIQDSWLMFIFLYLERLLFQQLSQLPENEVSEAAAINKLKSIINFLLVAGVDCDKVSNVDENGNAKTLRLACQTFLDEASHKADKPTKMDEIYKGILSQIVNFTPQQTMRLNR